MFKRLLIAVLVMGLGGVYAWYSKYRLDQELVGSGDQESLLRELPKIQFKTMTGEAYPLGPMSDKILLVHFWATWCGPCEAEIPEIMTLAASLPFVKLLVVAVNDEPMKIKKFMDRLKIQPAENVDWIIDNDQIHRVSFGTAKLPETYAFSSRGKMLRKFTGPQAWNKPNFLDMFQRFPR